MWPGGTQGDQRMARLPLQGRAKSARISPAAAAPPQRAPRCCAPTPAPRSPPSASAAQCGWRPRCPPAEGSAGGVSHRRGSKGKARAARASAAAPMAGCPFPVRMPETVLEQHRCRCASCQALRELAAATVPCPVRLHHGTASRPLPRRLLPLPRAPRRCSVSPGTSWRCSCSCRSRSPSRQSRSPKGRSGRAAARCRRSPRAAATRQTAARRRTLGPERRGGGRARARAGGGGGLVRAGPCSARGPGLDRDDLAHAAAAAAVSLAGTHGCEGCPIRALPRLLAPFPVSRVNSCMTAATSRTSCATGMCSW
jgi:hypothetical protein